MFCPNHAHNRHRLFEAAGKIDTKNPCRPMRGFAPWPDLSCEGQDKGQRMTTTLPTRTRSRNKGLAEFCDREKNKKNKDDRVSEETPTKYTAHADA